MDIGTGELIFPIGEMVGRYRLEALIGSGGMGQVYRAFHLDLEENFALKAIRREFISNHNEVERFRREAQVAHRLKHPNIVPIDDFNRHDGVCYLRMPYLRGIPIESKWAISLDQFVKIRGQPLEIHQVRQWLLDISRGVSYAHRRGIIHRDLKPSNILFDGDKAVVSDFGLVRIVNEELLQTMIRLSVYRSQVIYRDEISGERKSTSSDSAMVGTFEFMAPETKDGEEADERADIYAVGLIALYMLTGRTTPGVGMPSNNFSWIPAQWDAFFEKILAPDPDNRFYSAEEVIDWLDKSQEAKLVSAPVVKAGAMQANSPKKKGWGNWILISMFLLVAAAGGGYWAFLNNETVRDNVVKWIPALSSTAQEVEMNTVSTDSAGPLNELGSPADAVPDLLSFDSPGEGVIAELQGPSVDSIEIAEKSVDSPEPEAEPAAPEVEEPAGPSHGEVLAIPVPGSAATFDFIYLEGGPFFFGYLEDEKGHKPADENIQITKIIEKPFYMAKFETTQELYRAMMNGENPSRYFNNGRNPVNNLDNVKIDAFLMAFNAYLQEQGYTNLRAKLPTQYQWEYAARAGSPAAHGIDGFETGEDLPGLDKYARFKYPTFKEYDGPLPVGSLLPNQWGFHDFLGNIEEYTAGGYLRGGAFDSKEGDIRCASVRRMGGSIPKNDHVGFRLILEIE